MSHAAVTAYEIRRLLRDPALPVLLILFLGLGAYAAWNGADWLQQREAAIGLLVAEEQDMAARARTFVGNTPSVILPRAQPVLPPGSMAPLSIGQADAYPFTADVSALGDHTQLFGRVWADIGSPTARAAGRFDLAFVIVFLLPLVILATTYDLWSRERERGVAAMVLSQPIDVGSLIAAKALARGLLVLLPSVAIILAVAFCAGAKDPAGLTALALATLAYGCFWLAVAVTISFVARRSTEAAIAAGAVWLLVVVMAPSLALAAVDLVAPPPSEMRLATTIKARTAEVAERQRLHRATSPTPAHTPAPRLPDRLRDLHDDAAALDLELAPMIAAHRQAQDARRHLLDTVRFFLPSVAMQDALDRIAGSDADRALAFQSQVIAFWRERRLMHKGYLDRDTMQTLAEYDSMPRFQFRETGSAFQARVLADLAALIIASLLLLLAAPALRRHAATP